MYELLDPEVVTESLSSGVDTLPELMEYLDSRGSKYGISGAELLTAMPADAKSSPEAAYAFASNKDISHITPLSKGGDPAGDNWIWEDPSNNRSRGAETMSDHEKFEAKNDNVRDAKVARNALIGLGTYTAANIAIDALTATAVGGATVAAEAVIASVLIPTVCVGGIVGGGIWFLNRRISKLKTS